MLDDLTARVRKSELGRMLSGPVDHSNAIVSIHPGAGGTDAKDWAALDKAALDRFRDLRLRFGGHDGDRLYGQWETRGEEAVRQAIARPPALERDRAGELETSVLAHS